MSLSRFPRCLAACAAVLIAAGCDRAPAPQGEPGAAAPAAPQAEAPAAPEAPKEFGETALWADALATCSDKQVTTINWSKEAVAKGPATIELGDENPGVFARVGDEGKKETGPWAYPGAVVALRGDDGELRARLVMKGPNGCTAVTAPAGEGTGDASTAAPADAAAQPAASEPATATPGSPTN